MSWDVGVRQWLESFASAVRDQNYELGRALFAPDVVAFGTSTVMAVGLHELVAEQWEKVWGFIRRDRAGRRVGSIGTGGRRIFCATGMGAGWRCIRITR